VTAAFSPFLAWRYLAKRRINWLSIGGVMFAVWAMLVVDSVFTGFVSGIRSDVRYASPDLLVTDLPHDVDYETLRPALEATDGVDATAPRLRHYGLLQPLRAQQRTSGRGSSQLDFDHASAGFALLLGLDPARELRVTELRGWVQRELPSSLSHLPFAAGQDQFELLDESDPRRLVRFGLPDRIERQARIRASLPADENPADFRGDLPGVLFGADRMYRSRALRLGDPLELVTVSFQAADARGTAPLHTHALRVALAGVYRTGHRVFDEPTVLLPIETLRTMLGADAADPESPALITDIAVRVRPDLSPEALAALQQRLQADVQKLLPAGSAPCSVLDWRQQNPVMLSAVAHEQAMMQVVLFVVMIVAATVIFAILHLMVVQKTKDIGILAALGGAPRDIGRVFLLDGFVVALIGTGLGVLLGLLSVWNLNRANEWLYSNLGWELFPRVLFDLDGIPVRLEPGWVVSVALGALLLSLFVAWLPSRKAARLHPTTALAHE